MQKNKYVITLISFVLLTQTLFATNKMTKVAEGIERGGGGLLLVAFKKAAIEATTELDLLPNHFKKYLKFNTKDVYEMAQIFEVECAQGKALQYLRAKKVFAAVLEENKVNLLCQFSESPEQALTKDWYEAYMQINTEVTLNIKSKILVVHELLRLLGNHQENKHLSSASIASAYLEMNKFETQQLSEMIKESPPQAQQKGCSLLIRQRNGFCNRKTSTNHDFISVTIYKDELRVYEICSIDYNANAFIFRAKLLNVNRQDEDLKTVMKTMQVYSCFQYEKD